jgi:4-aminobutyrate aminotransferase
MSAPKCEPGSATELLERRRACATPRGVATTFSAFAASAENERLRDVEGREFIDCTAGIAVLNTGHRHPRVMAAVEQQLRAFTHTAYQVVPYESYVALAERLNALVPIIAPVKTVFFTTGAEAVENAVKIAQAATGRSAVISFVGGFHGRTALGMALTGRVAPYKSPFAALPPYVYHAPFPAGATSSDVNESLRALENVFYADIDPTRVAAIILEPVQGEGGFNVAPESFLKALRTLCDAHGIMLIADEIQTGFARTGRLFAMEHTGVRPDLLTMAKSMAGGLPLSAVSGRAKVMDAPAPGALGGTYAGSPLAIAAAHAVLDVLHDEGLSQRAEELGQSLREVLVQARRNAPWITGVRGVGSMIAVEFDTGERARAVQARAFEQGLLLLTCGRLGNVIRFLYPLTISGPRFRQMLGILRETFDACA